MTVNPIPFRTNGLDHLVLRVNNIETMLAFYCEVLKLPVKKHNKELGLWHLGAGTSMIDLIEISGPQRLASEVTLVKNRNVDHFALKIEPFDELDIRAYFGTHGVIVEPAQSRFGAEGYGLSIYLTDPEGNIVELKGKGDFE